MEPKDKPIERMFTWDDGRWGMVFGEPDDMFFGKPVFMEPVDKDRWDAIMRGEFESDADERGPEWFQRVRKG